MPKNQLVQYKGGGYDGCFWEWNFCFYDKDGKWHDIASSGIYGCRNEEAWLAYKARADKNEYSAYDLSNDGWGQFVKEAHESLVVGVGKYLLDHGFFPASIACSECGQLTSCNELESTSYRGNGGIGIITEDYVCGECYSKYACVYCGGYQGKDYDFCEEYFCEWCHEEHCEGKEETIEEEKD